MPDVKRWRVRDGCGAVDRVDRDGERRTYGPHDTFVATTDEVRGYRDKVVEHDTIAYSRRAVADLDVRPRPDGLYNVVLPRTGWRLNDAGLTRQEAESLL